MHNIPNGDETFSNTLNLDYKVSAQCILDAIDWLGEDRPIRYAVAPRIMSRSQYLGEIRLERSWSWRYWMGRGSNTH